MISYKHLSLADIFTDCQNIFDNDKYELLSLLDETMFDRLVDLTEPICQRIDKEKASMLLFDTSGIESYVTENNPKYANRIIKQLKSFKKANRLDDSFEPYKAAYGSMPPHAAANSAIQQMYINGLFCYAFKFGIITNGLGIARYISFYNKAFFKSHPEIIVEKKSAYQSPNVSGRCCFRFHRDLQIPAAGSAL